MKKLCSADHPVWAMAFRPLYLLCALYGAFSVLLWGFGFTGTRAISGYLWHAHEMVWGYAGGIVSAGIDGERCAEMAAAYLRQL